MSPYSLVENYVSAIESGELPSCRTVRLAVARWRRDMARCEEGGDLYFDRAAIKLIVLFIRGNKEIGYDGLKHFKGEWAGKKFEPEPWEWFVILSVFGFKWKSSKTRKYTYADVYVPRKNGKTTLAAVIALIMLIIDGEPAAEVYSFAVDKEQAKICFEASVQIATKSGLVPDVVQYFRKGSLVFESSAYKPLSKDTKNKDGLNPHCGIGDEAHAWKSFEIVEVVQTGMGARKQPLLFQISTAGTDTSYPYFGHLEYLRQILLGILENEDHFALLFEPDEGDRWDDEATWKKVNPNYGVSLKPKYMKDSYQKAKQKGGSTLAAFQTKNLNMWVDAPEVWIPDDDVVANNRDFDGAQLDGAECWVGIDLARKTDIVAVAFWFPKFKTSRFLFLVPEEKVSEPKRAEDRVDYRLWVEQGWLETVPGNVIDEDWFVSRVIQELDRYDVKAISYDPWGMWNVLGKFGRYQEKLLEYQQNIRYMSVPTKWVESAVLKHELNFLDNPVIRWMFKNVVIYTDPNANIKLDKARSRNKIDGVVALVDAVGGWLTKTAGKSDEIYSTHTLRTIKL